MTTTRRAKTLTFEEFLATYDDDKRLEWVNGEVLEVAPPLNNHQKVAFFLAFIMQAFVIVHRLGTIMIAEFLMKLPASARQPDLAFIATANLGRVLREFVDGPADLVVEVVSRSTARQDRVIKVREYEEGGVREYWLVDLPRRTLIIYVLGPDGTYQIAFQGESGQANSQVLAGFHVQAEWLWQVPLPSEMDALATLGIRFSAT